MEDGIDKPIFEGDHSNNILHIKDQVIKDQICMIQRGHL
jgi:hypothetical protein